MGQKRDWKQYNKQLVNRGKIHFWISPEVIKYWKAPKQKKNCRPFQYSNRLVQAICYIRFKFRIFLIETEGFFASLVALIMRDLPVPCYTQICRRMKTLAIPKHLLDKSNQNMNIKTLRNKRKRKIKKKEERNIKRLTTA